jgi:hypothetical protein
MALADDLNKLATQDVVYLTRTFSGMGIQGPQGHGSTEVFRGRLRQALNGDWVFNASTGQNGVVGFVIGSINQNSWISSESPASGLQVTVTFNALMVIVPNQENQAVTEVVVLTNVIPADFTD